VLFEGDVDLIHEEFHADVVTPGQLDSLLSDAWRHFGTYFFRYNLGFYDLDIRLVIPLRIRLKKFSKSKSQRRVDRANIDADVVIRPIQVTDEAVLLFERHKRRFKFGVPDSIYDFLSVVPSRVPCEAFELIVRLDGKLAAVSYFDVGVRSVSAIYAMFDPELRSRSLGIFTMLCEIEYAQSIGMEFYYQGYAYQGESFYDYKKRFRGTEMYDWRGKWKPFETTEVPNEDKADTADLK
jgi:leucyl-tRNA---protein transferase